MATWLHPDEQGDHVARRRREFAHSERCRRRTGGATNQRSLARAARRCRGAPGRRRASSRGARSPACPATSPGRRRAAARGVFQAVGGRSEARTERASTSGPHYQRGPRYRRGASRRRRADARRPDIYPRILNVPPLVRAISTISQSRKREQLGILTCDQNGYSNQKVVLRRRATGP